MNVVLKSFSEDVPLDDPKNVQRYLVFDANGQELRVPVGVEAIMALAKHVLGKKPVASEESFDDDKEPEELGDFEPESQEVVPEGASEYGGEEEEQEEVSSDPDDMVDEDPLRKFQLPPSPDGPLKPKSEDEVPSL